MSLDKIIPDNYFRNDRHRSLVNIIYTSHLLVENVKAFLETEDLTPQQYYVLRLLRNSINPLSTLQLRNMMIDKMSDTSRIVERLIKKDLVSKKINSYDKRLVDVSLTSKGILLVHRIEKKSVEIDSLLDNLTEQDIYALNIFLEKIQVKVNNQSAKE